MGSQIVLTMGQRHPFRIGLNKLRKILNDPAQLEELASQGLHQINLVADPVNAGHFKRVFQEPSFLAWANGSEKCDNKRSFYRFAEFKSEQQRTRARQTLVVLRDTLNSKLKYEALAQIGPCALTLDWDDEASWGQEAPVLVSNFIPACWPNADYSIRSTGETYFHS